MPGGTLVLDLNAELDKADPPGAPVVILTSTRDTLVVRRALARAARASSLGDEEGRALIGAIRGARSRQLGELGHELALPAAKVAPALTGRETEVLRLLALGFLNPEIAERLVLSVRTVEAHRSNIMRKTGCRSRAALVAYAFDRGIVER